MTKMFPINPSAQEVCSGIDEDCDGLVDDMDDSIDTSSNNNPVSRYGR